MKNPNLGRDIASKQALWLLELRKLIKRQSLESPAVEGVAASNATGVYPEPGSPTASDGMEVVEYEEFITKANTLGNGLHWEKGRLDYPRLTLDPAFITNRLVCPSLSKYVLPQWMLDEMRTQSRSICKTPNNPTRFRKVIPTPVPLLGNARSIIAHPAGIGDVPTVVVEDISTLPIVEDVPTLPVIEDIPTLTVVEDMPTMPAVEVSIIQRTLRRFSSTPPRITPMVSPERVEAVDRLQRKRKRPGPGALERAVFNASVVKRRKREDHGDRAGSSEGENEEKENVRLKKRRLARHAMDRV